MRSTWNLDPNPEWARKQYLCLHNYTTGVSVILFYTCSNVHIYRVAIHNSMMIQKAMKLLNRNWNLQWTSSNMWGLDPLKVTQLLDFGLRPFDSILLLKIASESEILVRDMYAPLRMNCHRFKSDSPNLKPNNWVMLLDLNS